MKHRKRIEACGRIRKLEGLIDVPIVALSANAFVEQQKKALDAGLTDYLTKPIEFDKLTSVLGKYLRKA